MHDDSVESGIDFRKASNITIGHVTTHHDHVDDDDDTNFSAKAARDLWERRTSFQSPAASRKSVTTQPGNNHPKLPTAVPTALTDNQSVTNEGTRVSKMYLLNYIKQLRLIRTLYGCDS